jgi:hypothetical protein
MVCKLIVKGNVTNEVLSLRATAKQSTEVSLRRAAKQSKTITIIAIIVVLSALLLFSMTACGQGAEEKTTGENLAGTIKTTATEQQKKDFVSAMQYWKATGTVTNNKVLEAISVRSKILIERMIEDLAEQGGGITSHDKNKSYEQYNFPAGRMIYYDSYSSPQRYSGAPYIEFIADYELPYNAAAFEFVQEDSARVKELYDQERHVPGSVQKTIAQAFYDLNKKHLMGKDAEYEQGFVTLRTVPGGKYSNYEIFVKKTAADRKNYEINFDFNNTDGERLFKNYCATLLEELCVELLYEIDGQKAYRLPGNLGFVYSYDATLNFALRSDKKPPLEGLGMITRKKS